MNALRYLPVLLNLFSQVHESYKISKNLHTSVSGGKEGIVNPMVFNMAPGYDNAQYEYVWISTSRIKG